MTAVIPLAAPLWDNDFAMEILPDLLKAFVTVTLLVTVLGSIVAAVLGLVLAVIRRMRVPVLSAVTTAFIEFIRSTPVPVQLFLVYYGSTSLVGVRLSAVTAGVAVLGVHYACYYAEVYRAGIEGVPQGQWEACTALSFSRTLEWQLVILPQAIRSVLPSLGNYVISMWKEVPFLVLISAPTMVQEATEAGAEKFSYVVPYTLAGLIFLAASYPSAVLMRRLEKRLGHA